MTRHQRIIRWELDVVDEERLLREVAQLESLARAGDAGAIRQALAGLVPEFSEAPARPIETAPAGPLVELPTTPAVAVARRRAGWSRLPRRAIEGTVAALVLALSTPLWVLLWFEARRRGERNIFVHELRVGRTRRQSVSPAAVTVERRARDLMGQPIRCARFRSDLGPVSRWVGRRHLDTLPFLVNVLNGEMALVGPAPEKGELVEHGRAMVPEYARRFTVLPGVTGLAQVSGYADSDVDGVVRQAHYDLFYVDHRSLLLDVRTLARTLGVLARRRAQAAPPPRDGGPVAKSVTR
jgi:lipopolysaccharide/colanic/teichoic acid biosynthesis glycosyltransferase